MTHEGEFFGNWRSAMEFEREELNSSDAAPISSQEEERRDTCCAARRFYKEAMGYGDEIGEDCMRILDNAETISQKYHCEGFYLETATQLKNITENRTKIGNAILNILIHHNRLFKLTPDNRILIERLKHDLNEVTRHAVRARIEKQQLEKELIQKDEQLKCLGLKHHVCEQKTRGYKNLVKMMNRRIRSITKDARAGKKVEGGFLGTHEDISNTVFRCCL